MYVPRANAVDDEETVRAFVGAAGAGDLITVGADGFPDATLLPVLWTGDRVLAHFARANPHWQRIAEDAPALLVVRGPQAYVSPSWYAAKAEHGRVVPTWNYFAVHLTGRVRVFDDADRLREVVTLLTQHHESNRQEPWAVEDAPEAYVAGQLRGIVGVEMLVERIEGKAKLSQNRSEADRIGVVAGLEAEPSADAALVAAQMRAALDTGSEPRPNQVE